MGGIVIEIKRENQNHLSFLASPRPEISMKATARWYSPSFSTPNPKKEHKARGNEPENILQRTSY
jgi:hypothetical protein